MSVKIGSTILNNNNTNHIVKTPTGAINRIITNSNGSNKLIWDKTKYNENNGYCKMSVSDWNSSYKLATDSSHYWGSYYIMTINISFRVSFNINNSISDPSGHNDWTRVSTGQLKSASANVSLRLPDLVDANNSWYYGQAGYTQNGNNYNLSITSPSNIAVPSNNVAEKYWTYTFSLRFDITPSDYNRIKNKSKPDLSVTINSFTYNIGWNHTFTNNTYGNSYSTTSSYSLTKAANENSYVNKSIIIPV